MDYTEVVYLVSSDTSQFQRHAAINGDIKVLLERDWVCKLQHVYREGNEAADFLVKLGAISRTSNVWDSPPTGLGHILLSHLARVVYMR